MEDRYQRDADWLNRVLNPAAWPHGEVLAFGHTQIGQGFGLSGTTYRLSATTTGGEAHSLVAKFEKRSNVEAAVAFRAQNEERMGSSIPASFGHSLDEPGDEGVIILEDIAPSTQGDELASATRSQATGLVGVLAKLHGGSWQHTPPEPTTTIHWAARHWEPERWQARIELARQRYPDALTAGRVNRLNRFDLEVTAAIDSLADGPVAWVHHDPHWDNVLWRADGTTVLIDWAGAGIAPPALDIAVLLMSTSLRTGPALPVHEALGIYSDRLVDHGVSVDPGAIEATARLALRPLIRGIVGWAGSPDESEGRKLELRNGAIEMVMIALDWIDESAAPNGS